LTLSGLLQRITSILDDASIPYMLTGSLAAAFYAVPRATQDLDLVLEVSPDQLEGLSEAIVGLGLYMDLGAAREALRQEGQFNAIDPETGWKVDFIVRKGRAFSLSEFGRRRERKLFGQDVSMVSLEDLVIAKLEWAKKGESELQLIDVEALLRNSPPDLDRAYLERWIEELGLGAEWEEVLPVLRGASRRGPSD
jgi:hypothetical protein